MYIQEEPPLERPFYPFYLLSSKPTMDSRVQMGKNKGQEVGSSCLTTHVFMRTKCIIPHTLSKKVRIFLKFLPLTSN